VTAAAARCRVSRREDLGIGQPFGRGAAALGAAAVV